MTILYDQFGREVTVPRRPEAREIAVTTVRDRWSGYPSQGLTPAKLASIFKQADSGDIYRQAELFEEMEEKDTHLFSQLQTRKNAVLGLEYNVSPYSDSPEDKKIAEFCSDNILNLNDFDDTLLDLLDAIGKGYSMAEIIWAIEGQAAIIKGLRWIHAKKAVFYDLGAGSWERSYEIPRVITEAEPARGEIMPPFKLVYHRYKARSGYDTRAGVLRVCAWMYLFKNYAIKDWVAFAEVFGMPLRLGKYDTGASKNDKDALAAAISSLGSDAAGIISKNTEIEFIETVKTMSSGNLYETLASFSNKEQSKAILGQTLTTQEGKSGSYSLGQVHDLVRHDLIKADCEALAKTLRFQVIRPLVGYNFGWDKSLPTFNFLFELPEDLKAISEVYKNLSEINYPLTVEHVSERFKVPTPQAGETVLAPKAGGQRTEDRGQRTEASFSVIPAKAGIRTDQDLSPADTLDALGEKTLAAADLTGLIGPVEDLLKSVNSLGEFQDRLMELYDDMDETALGDLMARALAIANLSGRFDAGER